MPEKTAAYLAAGAKEVWIVDEDGAPEIHTSTGRVSASTLGFEVRAYLNIDSARSRAAAT